VKTSDFDFELPPELIAQRPPAERGQSRLLVLDRRAPALEHTTFARLADYLREGDLLVLNDTRVFPARLLGRRVPSGGAVECLLLEQVADPESRAQKAGPGGAVAETWIALMHPGQKLKPGARVRFEGEGGTLHGEVVDRRFFGRRTIRLWSEDGSTVLSAVERIGHIPLPPYISRADDADDRERYQTVFAASTGSIAAPTAGLHFTPALLDELERRGVERTAITLHVGYGTFKPVRVDLVEEHAVDPEHYVVSDEAAGALTRALRAGRRIIAVGTTTTRTLESLDLAGGRVRPGTGVTRLFIHPGHRFHVVQGLVTNFHLPRSSLLMLVAAFARRERVLAAYAEAIARGYRFYSYGDAMLIV
jgi:S-adenosylmethionine:tRNA ribosyltransferase-isomerase